MFDIKTVDNNKLLIVFYTIFIKSISRMYFSTVLGGMISAMFYCKNEFLGFHCVNQNLLNFKYYTFFLAIKPL